MIVPRIVCSYCGLPFRSLRPADNEPAYCCSGCAMAARLNISGEKFPVTPQLVYGLILGFGIFNQALLIVLAFALVNERRLETAEKFAAVAAVLAIVLFVVALAWQWRARLMRRTDLAAFVIAGVFLMADAFLLSKSAFGAASLAGLAATGLAAMWQARGFPRKWLGRAMRRGR
jgi:hypothetical protein